jgi:hypothetical protein
MTPKYDYAYWRDEIAAAQKRLRRWHKQGDKTVDRFLDKDIGSTLGEQAFRLNLFHANVVTLRSMLYGRVPQVDVSRRYADPADDVARVAAEILQRMLNNDIEEAGEDFAAVLRSALDDRLIPGLGSARIKYAVETEEVEHEALVAEDGMVLAEGWAEERLVSEQTETVYTHWRDILWGYGRSYSEIPWFAVRSHLRKDEAAKRFGKDKAEKLEYTRQSPSGTSREVRSMDSQEMRDNHATAEIWEIWCKETRKVYWCSGSLLDQKDDPLELDGFFPFPPPMMANLTTTLYLPKPDYAMSQDLYQEVDILQTRISILTKAVKAVGVYDKSATGVQRMFQEGVENDLIPVDNWAMFAEKGGLQGTIDWVPIVDVVNALDKLRQVRDETIQLLYQVSGMSDIMRGAAAQSGGQPSSATENALKARFASIRVQALQDEFARFASNLQSIKAEVISKHYDPQTILQQSGIMNTVDAMYAEQAIGLIKDWDTAQWRIEIRPESVAMIDYARLKSERTEFITALATFMQSAAPLVQQSSEAAPFLLQLLKWGLAGFKGAQQIEGVMDQAISMYEKKAQQPQQGQQSPEAMKAKAEMLKQQMKFQQDMQKQMAKSNADLQKLQAQLQAELMKLRAKTQGAIVEEAAQAKFNMQETLLEAAVKQ